MQILLITKYVEEVYQGTNKVPLFIVRALQRIMPASGRYLLSLKAVDLDEILVAAKQSTTFYKTIYVCEHGVEKKIILTLQQ